jgi:hypothetical protein
MLDHIEGLGLHYDRLQVTRNARCGRLRLYLHRQPRRND